MQTKTQQGIDLTEANRRTEIRIDRIKLLTGVMGLGYLMVSWGSVVMLPIFFGAIGWSIANGKFPTDLSVAAIIGIFALVFVLVFLISLIAFCVTRWIARGFLNGRRGPAILGACLLFVSPMVMAIRFVVGNSDSRDFSGFFSTLSDKSYWKRVRDEFHSRGTRMV